MRPQPLAASLALLLALVMSGSAAAQTSTSRLASVLPEPPRTVAQALVGTVAVDGRIDEAAWASATPITTFTQVDPVEGEPASEATEARILYDADALYLAVRARDSRPVTSRLGRRDMDMGDSDWIGVALDSYHDHRTAFVFHVNPAGVRRDGVRTGEMDDMSWDAVWESAAQVDEEGWSVEVRIPLSQLRFAGAATQTWGLQLERILARNGEWSVFAFTPKSELAGVARYGHLTGLQGLEARKRVELLPYVVTRAERVDRGGNPFREDAENGLTGGLDAKVRLSSELTLDATVNPDFGQVEQDPAVVNLSAFETFFEERRPFFVEGAGQFRFGGGAQGPGSSWANLFYSRRIGRTPRLGAPTAEADRPDVSTILGAAKVSGQTQGGWSLGVLEAVTERETARYRLQAGGEVYETTVEPLTSYFAGRASRRYREGRTVLGAMANAVHRDMAESAPEHALAAADVLTSSALTGGVDASHEWANRRWRLSGFLAGSRVAGSPAALTRLQRSSARYFDRPDAGHLELDPQRTSLAGWAGQLQVVKQSGRRWVGDAAVFAAAPGYEINDLGFMNRTDQMGANYRVSWQKREAGEHFRYRGVNHFGTMSANFAGDVIDRTLFLGTYAELHNFWGGYVNVQRSFESWDDRLARGGPLMRSAASWQNMANIYSDRRQPVTLRAGYTVRSWSTGANSFSGSTDLALKASERWSLTLSPGYDRLFTTLQHRSTYDDPAATATAGRRVLFADLEHTTVRLGTRLNVTFAPGATLELYAEPFVSAGDFGPPKQLAAARTRELQELGVDAGTREAVTLADGRRAWRVDPDGDGPARDVTLVEGDFSVRSLRGNAVLRYEWRPGSVLYVAWQQNRSATGIDGTFDLARDTDRLFGAAPDNVLLMKVSYWLNI